MKSFLPFKHTCATVAAVVVLAVFTGAAMAQTIKTIDVPNSTGTIPRAINNSGEIVGDYLDSNGRYRGFLQQRNGRFVTLDLQGERYPSHWQTHGVSINVSGDMIGYTSIAGGGDRGFLRQNSGKIVLFNSGGDVTPSAELAEPYPVPDCLDGVEPLAINAVEEITGSVHCTVGILRQRDGTITSFRVDVDGDLADTFPQAINLKAQITGYYRPLRIGPRFDGFLRQRDGGVVTYSGFKMSNVSNKKSEPELP